MASPSSTIVSKFQSYLDRAKELEEQLPLVSFYLKYYVLESLMKLRKKGQKDAESEKLMMFLLGELENAKKIPIKVNNNNQSSNQSDEMMNNSYKIGENREKDKLLVQDFVLAVFKRADDLDRSGVCDQKTAMQFFYASKFFDILEQFYDDPDNNSVGSVLGGPQYLPPDLQEKRKYCKYKTQYIRDCLKKGIRPTPGPPGGESETQAEADLERQIQLMMGGLNNKDETIPQPPIGGVSTPTNNISAPTTTATAIEPAANAPSVPLVAPNSPQKRLSQGSNVSGELNVLNRSGRSGDFNICAASGADTSGSSFNSKPSAEPLIIEPGMVTVLSSSQASGNSMSNVGTQQQPLVIESAQVSVVSQSQIGNISGITQQQFSGIPQSNVSPVKATVISTSVTAGVTTGPVMHKTSSVPGSADASHKALSAFEKKQAVKQLLKTAEQCLDFDDLAGCKSVLQKAIANLGE